MLCLQKRVTLHQIFIIFDGVNIDIAQSADRFLDRLRLLFHLSEVVHRLIPKLRCIPEGQFILIPHVVDLILHGLLQLFLLGI